MKNKFKVGDKVVFSSKMLGFTHGPIVDFDQKIRKISEVDQGRYRLEGLPSNWFGEHELILVEFCLSNLQFADVVILRNDEKYVVADGYLYGEKETYCSDGDELSEYNDDLTYSDSYYKECDIVKVERNGQVVFERKETVEMTVSEIEKKLGITGLRIKKED